MNKEEKHIRIENSKFAFIYIANIVETILLIILLIKSI